MPWYRPCVRFAFTEEQQELRAQARAFLAEHSSGDEVRRAMESELGWDPDVWERIAGELGWAGVIVPEELGGVGLGQVELVGLMEEMGAALLCAPFFSTVCLGANALLAAASESQRKAWLPRIASGQLLATLAHTGPGGRPGAEGVEATWRREGPEYVLEGVARPVIDGHAAELVLVAARAPGSAGAEGVSLFALEGNPAGLERTPLVGMDQTRRLAELQLHGVRVSADARLGGEGEAWPVLASALDLATVGLCAEQVGGAQRCLDLSVAYARERQQFGRPIGSFQAIKHKCANMLLLVESARSAAYYAGWAAAESEAELPALASLAKAYGSEAYFRCAAEAIQIHGGVGFTWEYDPHLYFKRARASEALLGTPAYHREQLARHIGL
jgi:alkylation response protein AidB-like acyl-CoA dehydrogenase